MKRATEKSTNKYPNHTKTVQLSNIKNSGWWTDLSIQGKPFLQG